MVPRRVAALLCVVILGHSVAPYMGDLLLLVLLVHAAADLWPTPPTCAGSNTAAFGGALSTNSLS